jgi:hypothetical protein
MYLNFLFLRYIGYSVGGTYPYAQSAADALIFIVCYPSPEALGRWHWWVKLYLARFNPFQYSQQVIRYVRQRKQIGKGLFEELLDVDK